MVAEELKNTIVLTFLSELTIPVQTTQTLPASQFSGMSTRAGVHCSLYLREGPS